MSKHTPGPWVKADGADSHMFDARIMAGDVCVAFTNDEEDADLIAAAPELLDVLKAYRLNYSDDDLQTLANITSGRGEISPNVARREIIARAAIAKAEGRGA